MQPHGVFNTLCDLKADQSVLKPLLAQYTHDNESEFPCEDVALARALQENNQEDVKILVKKI